MARVRTCIICFDNMKVTRQGKVLGLTCNHGHYVCDEDLDGLVKCAFPGWRLDDPERERIKCAIPDCKSYWEYQKHVAYRISRETKKLYRVFEKSQKKERRRRARQEQLLHEEQASERQKIQALRHKIVEEILNTKCPRCGVVFFDYDGCEALMCTSCQTGFCALCLKDTKGDAHRHLLYHHGGYFNGGMKKMFEVHNERRVSEISQLLNEPCYRKIASKVLEELRTLMTTGPVPLYPPSDYFSVSDFFDKEILALKKHAHTRGGLKRNVFFWEEGRRRDPASYTYHKGLRSTAEGKHPIEASGEEEWEMAMGKTKLFWTW